MQVGETLLKIQVNESPIPGVTIDYSENANSSGSDDEKGKRGRVLSTPAVRSLAKRHNIDINDVCGTGKDGRVLKEDVLDYAIKKGIIKDTSVSLNADYGQQPWVVEENSCGVTVKVERPFEDRILLLR